MTLCSAEALKKKKSGFLFFLAHLSRNVCTNEEVLIVIINSEEFCYLSFVYSVDLQMLIIFCIIGL